MLRWFFWLGPRPKFDRWTYFEKFDYWGEIWGVFVIGGTGLILWFPTLFARWLPGWILNCAMVIHSIEALLAASVIFLVHFFNTHLRPDKFPVDMTMFTGRMTETEMKEERTDEYKRLMESGELEKRIVNPLPWQWRLVGVIAGILAFLFGLFLIALAIETEIAQFFT
jgi:cytochrome b subunit of formate dehydrogenase